MPVILLYIDRMRHFSSQSHFWQSPQKSFRVTINDPIPIIQILTEIKHIPPHQFTESLPGERAVLLIPQVTGLLRNH